MASEEAARIIDLYSAMRRTGSRAGPAPACLKSPGSTGPGAAAPCCADPRSRLRLREPMAAYLIELGHSVVGVDLSRP